MTFLSNHTAAAEIYTLSLHDALPISFEVRSGDFLLLTSDGLTGHVTDEEILKEVTSGGSAQSSVDFLIAQANSRGGDDNIRSEEHTSELQSRPHLVCRLLLEKKKKKE